MKPQWRNFPEQVRAVLQSPTEPFRSDRLTVRQIYYNEETRSLCDPAFVPLDNTANPRPDWYELWPILQFFRQNPPQDGQWYGFLSPQFQKKLNMSGAQFLGFLSSLDGRPADSVTVLKEWDQVTWFQNVFFQGEHHHKGLLSVSQAFLKQASWPLNLNEYMGHSANTVFSNYLVASARFWRLWVYLAESLVAMVEDSRHPLHAVLKAQTKYGAGQAGRFVFLQERLSNIILALPGWTNLPIVNREATSFIFSNDAQTRAVMALCDDTKKQADGRNTAQIKAQFLQHRSSLTPLPNFYQIQDK